MAGKKSSQRELRWQDLVDRQARSGLSIREFCTKEKISQPSFYAWRRKLRDQDGSKARPRSSSRGVVHKGSGEESENGRGFVPLTLVDGASVLEVVHPFGYRVRVTGEVDVNALQRVLDALDRRSKQ